MLTVRCSDIPMPLVSSGVENGNLRELALARMKDFGAECRDVRYREVGVCHLQDTKRGEDTYRHQQIHEIHHRVRPQDLELLRRDYTANGGWETFLSYEDPTQDILVGLLRLRKCSEEGTFRQELVGMEGGCSLVRELVLYYFSSLLLLYREWLLISVWFIACIRHSCTCTFS